MMRVAKFWSFGVCRLSNIMGLDGNQLLVLEKNTSEKINSVSFSRNHDSDVEDTDA